MTTDDVRRLRAELGFDALGVARAEAYEATERHIRERRERGLFAGMKFTMAQPETSCHPETLLPGARSVVSAARVLLAAGGAARSRARGASRATPGTTRTTQLREQLDALGRRLGGSYRVLVDANQHVDREAAARSGVGFYGKNTMLITRRHGSWVVLGTLVTDVELEPTPPLGPAAASARSASTRARRVRSTSPARSTRRSASPTGRRRRAPIPEAYRSELGAQVYGCDICQDVCPWNRGVEKRRAGDAPSGDAHVDLVAWLEADGRALVDDYERLYVPRNDPRWLRRNALVALGNTGGAEHVPLLERYADGDDAMLAEHARGRSRG